MFRVLSQRKDDYSPSLGGTPLLTIGNPLPGPADVDKGAW